MRVPLSWLAEHCDPGMEPGALAERLAMTGTEVERVTTAGPPSPDNFVIGRVLSAEQHPNADRLRVCTVDTGDGEHTIVCGAPNVAAGQTVAVARPGAVMPDGTELGRAKLRGVESDGMILSERELGVGEDHDGILVLADGDSREAALSPGTPLAETIPLAEPVLELEVTSNRPDCLSIRGVAREVHAITDADLAPDPWEGDAEATGDDAVTDYASVTVEVPDLCPRFTARVFEDVTIGPSPAWLKARLMAAGQRPINNVVDITNYVMLLTAQPLHAFDLDLVPNGQLIIRTAHAGEKMMTLDGVERTFDEGTVLVCDRNGPTGVAGVMGGQVSEVSENTTRVLLEAANWNGPNVLQTSRRLALRSEASSRFEKQIHPALCMRGQRIASRLLVEICGARLVPGTIDVDAGMPEPHQLTLRNERVERLLGMPIPITDQAAYLERLGFAVSEGEGGLGVSVPPDRHYDVTREADLIEEVARVHGLEGRLPATLPSTGGQAGRLSRSQLLLRRAEDVMRDLGFDEIVGWSFAAPDLPKRLRIPADDSRTSTVRISNPLAEDASTMRTTLLGSLLDAARYNLARGAERLALFESGRAYLVGGDTAGDIDPLAGRFPGEQAPPVLEPHRIAALATGDPPPSWSGRGTRWGFFELKGVLEALAEQLGATLTFSEAEEPFLHPGRSAQVSVEETPAGWIGEVHPLVCREWDLPAAVAFEVDFAPLAAAATAGEEAYRDVTTYPAVLQDLAVVVGEEIPAATVRHVVLGAGGELLADARVFDLFHGEQVGEGRKSIALRLEFRAPDRTLTDEEVGGLRDRIERALENIGGTLRG